MNNYWFEIEEDGNVSLVTEAGDRVTMTEQAPDFYHSQSVHGKQEWQRVMLQMAEDDDLDPMQLGALMKMVICDAMILNEGDEPYFLVSSSVAAAEGKLFPFISEALAEECLANVEKFFASPAAQQKWYDYLLRPICLKVNADCSKAVPVLLGEENIPGLKFLEGMHGVDFARFEEAAEYLINEYLG